VPSEGTGRAQNALEFEAGDDIGKAGVVIGVVFGRIEHLVAPSQDHRPHLDVHPSQGIVEPDGLGQADGFTKSAPHAGIRVDGIDQGHGLGIADGGGCPGIEPRIELVDGGHRTYLGTDSASRAFLKIDEPRITLEKGLEVPRLPLDCLDLGVGDDSNV